MTALLALARHVGTAVLAGVITGVAVGGLLGRVVMRISGFSAGPAGVGALTANDNRVGEITLSGTFALIVFVGLGTGIVGGVIYAAVEPWLRRFRPWHGLVYGAALLATLGFSVIDPSNFDFRRFGAPALNVAMFAALFIAFGVGIAWLFAQVRARIARGGPGARVIEVLTWPALGLGVLVTGAAGVSAVTSPADSVFPLLVGFGLLVATFAQWRRLPRAIGYVALASLLLLGTWRTVGGIAELIARI